MTLSSAPPPSAPDDPILTTRTAGRLLGVAVSTAQLWMESGAINSWKTPGGHRRCRLSALQHLMPQPERKANVPLALPAEFFPVQRPSYPTSAQEGARLFALAASNLVDSEPEVGFDRITWLASQLTACPMALVSLLTSQRQWFKSRVGIDVQETPRDAAFCSYTIMDKQGLVVEDAWKDARFKDNPLVTGAPFIRFYAGMPVRDGAGQYLGSLCVLDVEPRVLNTQQLLGLSELAEMVSTEIARGN